MYLTIGFEFMEDKYMLCLFSFWRVYLPKLTLDKHISSWFKNNIDLMPSDWLSTYVHMHNHVLVFHTTSGGWDAFAFVAVDQANSPASRWTSIWSDRWDTTWSRCTSRPSSLSSSPGCPSGSTWMLHLPGWRWASPLCLPWPPRAPAPELLFQR